MTESKKSKIKTKTAEQFHRKPGENGGNSDAADHHVEANPAINLEKALRQLVREELRRPVAPDSAEAKPTFADAFWWFLCVVDVGLLIWWIPENLLTDKKLDFFIKAVAWVGSYLFLLGYAWFKNQILAFTRRLAFKFVILAMLAVLTPFYVSLLPIFRIHPLVEPENAELTIDGNSANPAELRLSLGKHAITVADKKSNPDKIKTRDFELGYLDFFRTWSRSDYRPRWPLLYVVGVTAQESGLEIVVEKQDGDFDADFVKPGRVTSFGSVINFENSAKPTISFAGTDNGVDSIELPYGTYEVFARKADCGKSPTQKFSSFQPGVVIEFEQLCKPAQP